MAKRSQLPKGGARPNAARSAAARRSSSRIILVAVVAAVLLVVAGIILLQMQSARKPIEISGRTGEGTSWGPQGAKVVITDYSDFGCVHCGNFALGAGKQLRQDYEPGGNVRFEYKHFIINPPDTANAANAAECAADQGRFWDYHDLLFSQQGITQNPFAKAALKEYASKLGFDTARFNSCVDRDEHLDKVYRDSADGRNAGVEGTPTFFVNGQKFVGEVNYTDFKAHVEAALAKAP